MSHLRLLWLLQSHASQFLQILETKDGSTFALHFDMTDLDVRSAEITFSFFDHFQKFHLFLSSFEVWTHVQKLVSIVAL